LTKSCFVKLNINAANFYFNLEDGLIVRFSWKVIRLAKHPETEYKLLKPH